MNDRLLGHDPGPIQAARLSDLRRLSEALVRQARQDIAILSLDLDAPVYNQKSFLDALKEFALGSPRRRVRILFQDPRQALETDHRLPSLAERLSSRILFRRLPELDEEVSACLLLADRYGYLRRPGCRLGDAVADFHAPLEVAREREAFDEYWERSTEDQTLRRLYL